MRIIIALVVTLILASSSAWTGKVIEGESNTFLSQYKIEEISKNTYLLTYAKSTEKFTVTVCPRKSDCCYIVRTDKFEVMYQCTKNGFGMRHITKEFKSMEPKRYMKHLNSDAFNQQSLLSPNTKTKEEALCLIACFLPLVVNYQSQKQLLND